MHPTTTPTAPEPVAAIAPPDSYRVGYIYSTIRSLPNSQTRTDLLGAIDAIETDIIKASHAHGIELDRRSRAAMARILASTEALR